MLARCNRVRYGFSLKYLSENVSGPISLIFEQRGDFPEQYSQRWRKGH